jgi:RNA polymerase sigma-70 factor (ECF subfamily)
LDYAALSSDELVRLCLASHDEAAWSEFVRRFHPLIATVVLRMCRKWGDDSPQIVDDLVQETYLKLCTGRDRLLQNFRPAHPDAIFGYIKVFTANLVHDHFKALHTQRRGGTTLQSSVDCELEANLPSTAADARSMERAVLIGEIDACLRAVETGPNVDRDRRIFWLYYRVGLSANAIASLPSTGLTTKGVESTISRLTRHVKFRLVHRGPIAGEDAPEKGIRPAESL